MFLCSASSSQAQGPLNASVSSFGTSFIFGPAPICKGCIENELGFAVVGKDRVISSTSTVSLFSGTDISLFWNPIETVGDGLDKKDQLGRRLDVIARMKVYSGSSAAFSFAPRVTTLLTNREFALGGTGVLQYARGKHMIVGNATLMKSPASHTDLPMTDTQLAFDYSFSIGSRGTGVFGGALYRKATSEPVTHGLEAGVVLPFRDGQIEFATERFAAEQSPYWQFQVRIIRNWGRVF